MVAGPPDALSRWATQHRVLGGVLFGAVAALVVSVAMAITGVPWTAIVLAAVVAGLFTGLPVASSGRSLHSYDPATAARPGTNRPCVSLPAGIRKGGLPEDVSRRDKAIIFLGCTAWSVFIVVEGLVLQAKPLSYQGLAALLILLDGVALWFWVTRDRDG